MVCVVRGLMLEFRHLIHCIKSCIEITAFMVYTIIALHLKSVERKERLHDDHYQNHRVGLLLPLGRLDPPAAAWREHAYAAPAGSCCWFRLGSYFTLRTRGLFSLRLLPDMVCLITGSEKDGRFVSRTEKLASCPGFRRSLPPPLPGSVWAISSGSWPQSQQVAQALFSGCG